MARKPPPPGARISADPPVLPGAYLHWTRTIAGKTVTRTLTKEQAARYQAWFDDARRLRELIATVEARSLTAFDAAEDPAGKSSR